MNIFYYSYRTRRLATGLVRDVFIHTTPHILHDDEIKIYNNFRDFIYILEVMRFDEFYFIK